MCVHWLGGLNLLLTLAPKGGVIVITCAVRVVAVLAAGINLVGVPQTKPMQRFPPNFRNILTTYWSRVDLVFSSNRQQLLPWQHFFRSLGLKPSICINVCGQTSLF